ncbi:MAG: RNB domain-containing ribonuclease [Treponema sp.]|uniref:ribonuclease catalytic domain-containing protein n=1 Tax=Treponema sp. TaxID=166 RepID=UPI001DD65865|nr:RNB domain-containing ribonuclease [Treponema sp.]MBS7241718.1 RNB domain-containing ribonuclease [Treponema sp.]
MLKVNSVVIYKNSPAVISAVLENAKYTVKFQSTPATATKGAVYGEQNVREKDMILLHEGPCSSLANVLSFAEEKCPLVENLYNLEDKNEIGLQVKDCYELLASDDETKGTSFEFEELVSLFHDKMTADESWGMFCALKNTVWFNQNLKEQMNGKLVFTLRSQKEIDSLVKKADAKGKEAELRAAFLERLKANSLLPEDSIYMGDVEALALGKTDKSRTMHDAGIKETVEKAHKLLLDTGVWDITRNPYPVRWGLSMKSASESLASPPQEERYEVPGVSYAIDAENSADPDDAVAYDGKYYWVHIADPASTVIPDSSIDKAARERGATLYIPEGAARMLCEDALEDYALGLKEKSNALSFRLLLDDDANVLECAVMKTVVDVKRLSYRKAEELKESPELKPLFEIARKNVDKRNKAGAVQITMPEVHIYVDRETKKVSVVKDEKYESNEMIRELMLLAGEGAAKFAFQNNIPFPYVSQEEPQIPDEIPEGLAGQFRLRRCMRKRSVGVTPGMHCGLGLHMYSQVTSPLRRYGDLISHQQLRAFIDGRKLLDKDTMLMRISEGDAGAMAARKSERNSNLHWTLVYLLQNPEWTGDAVCVSHAEGKLPQFCIPELAQEAFFDVPGGVELNQTVKVKVSRINLPELQVEFMVAQ